jgi:hypothetical protein
MVIFAAPARSLAAIRSTTGSRPIRTAIRLLGKCLLIAGALLLVLLVFGLIRQATAGLGWRSDEYATISVIVLSVLLFAIKVPLGMRRPVRCRPGRDAEEHAIVSHQHDP